MHSQLLLQIQFSTNHCLFHHLQTIRLHCYHWSHLLLHQCVHLDIHENHHLHWRSHKCQLILDYLCSYNWCNNKSVHGKLTAAQLQWFVVHLDFLQLQETNSTMESGAGFKCLHWTAKDPSISVQPCSTRWGRRGW